MCARAGLADNVRLIQASLCTNPVLQHQVTFFPLGLSAKNDTCWVIAGTGNLGDGFTMCGHNSSEQAQKAAQEGYTVRSSMMVRRLDDLVQEDIKVGFASKECCCCEHGACLQQWHMRAMRGNSLCTAQLQCDLAQLGQLCASSCSRWQLGLRLEHCLAQLRQSCTTPRCAS